MRRRRLFCSSRLNRTVRFISSSSTMRYHPSTWHSRLFCRLLSAYFTCFICHQSGFESNCVVYYARASWQDNGNPHGIGVNAFFPSDQHFIMSGNDVFDKFLIISTNLLQISRKLVYYNNFGTICSWDVANSATRCRFKWAICAIAVLTVSVGLRCLQANVL